VGNSGQGRKIRARHFSFRRQAVEECAASVQFTNQFLRVTDLVVQRPEGRATAEGVFEGSLRGSYTLDKNLGSIAAVLAQQLGGSGGGHKKAAGVRVPVTRLEEFLGQLDHRLEA
jgi:single-stranded DNA-specific DHH superfamily exonuclease